MGLAYFGIRFAIFRLWLRKSSPSAARNPLRKRLNLRLQSELKRYLIGLKSLMWLGFSRKRIGEWVNANVNVLTLHLT
ncbi:MAG: hypothetical protein AAFW60_09525 [Pseudomonadota bacterium]